MPPTDKSSPTSIRTFYQRPECDHVLAGTEVAALEVELPYAVGDMGDVQSSTIGVPESDDILMFFEAQVRLYSQLLCYDDCCRSSDY